MAIGPPPFLIAQVRCAFHQVAQQKRSTDVRLFSTFRQQQFRNSSKYSSRSPASTKPPVKGLQSSERSKASPPVESGGRSPTNSVTTNEVSKELVPQSRDGRAVGTGRTVDAPLRIIPKADITPNLKLTPKERLHIEILTRRAPPVVKQTKPYKERLLIYHHGNLAENALVFLKVLGLVCAGVVTCVVVPAHYVAGSSPWLCGALFLSGLFPSVFFHRLLKPLVTRIHLRLPPAARASPEAAMKYAKNLPASAQLDLSFTRITALPGTVTAVVTDLQPISQASRWPWQFANIRWTGDSVDRGGLLRPNPTKFSVKAVVGPGRARRDVIPGIWPEVFKRLTGETKEQGSRWRKS